MKKQLIIIGIIIILLTVGLSGCNENSPKYSVIGTWKDTYDDIWEFGNNTVYIGVGANDTYNYKIKDNKLYIENWLGEDGYYIMNWVNDKKLELSFQSGNGQNLTEILYKQ